MTTLAIHALLYGDYPHIHRRLIDSLLQHAAPHAGVRIMLWCNQVCGETRAYLEPLPFTCIWSDENVKKYPAMRQMFHQEISEEWVVWFDDDAFIQAPDWLEKTRAFIESKRSEDICYFGDPWLMPYLPGRWDFIRQSAWFQNRRSAVVNGSPGVTFAQGSYWWLRTDILRLLDWPDHRLVHNGGDSLLAEAIRQNGLPAHDYAYGVTINDAPRRGYHEAPAGSSDPSRRQ